MFILGRFRNIIFHSLESVLWGNLITLQGIYNADDVIAFFIFAHEQNAGKSYLRNPPYPSTKYINLLLFPQPKNIHQNQSRNNSWLY